MPPLPATALSSSESIFNDLFILTYHCHRYQSLSYYLHCCEYCFFFVLSIEEVGYFGYLSMVTFALLHSLQQHLPSKHFSTCQQLAIAIINFIKQLTIIIVVMGSNQLLNHWFPSKAKAPQLNSSLMLDFNSAFVVKLVSYIITIIHLAITIDYKYYFKHFIIANTIAISFNFGFNCSYHYCHFLFMFITIVFIFFEAIFSQHQLIFFFLFFS